MNRSSDRSPLRYPRERYVVAFNVFLVASGSVQFPVEVQPAISVAMLSIGRTSLSATRRSVSPPASKAPPRSAVVIRKFREIGAAMKLPGVEEGMKAFGAQVQNAEPGNKDEPPGEKVIEPFGE